MNTDLIVEVRNFHGNNLVTTGIAIPRKLPISRRRGSEKLETLRRRAEFLQKHIAGVPPEKNMDFAKAELAALRWVIKTIIMYENLLKKDPDDEGGKEKPHGENQADTR